LYELAKLDRAANAPRAALAKLDRALGHTRQFWPIISRHVRARIVLMREELLDELGRGDQDLEERITYLRQAGSLDESSVASEAWLALARIELWRGERAAARLLAERVLAAESWQATPQTRRAAEQFLATV
jgi:hypothetical protein